MFCYQAMTDTVIKLDSVSKSYRLGQYAYSTFRESVYKSFRKAFKQKNSDSNGVQELWALKNVSFELRRGEAIGIIGPNGAGKSTILKIMAGVTSPTKGRISINGKIAAMIELSAGFHGELTGRENIYLNGAIMGMTKKEIREKFDSIVEFSELSLFIDTPFKRYSSGMKARLGFAVAIHTEPDILLIDEVLSVGDFAFQNKCIKKMEEYISKGVNIVFVSHNLNAIRKLCYRTIVLHKGNVIANDDTEKSFGIFYDVFSTNMLVQRPAEGKRSNNNEKKAEIINVTLLNEKGEPSQSFKSGDRASLIVNCKFYEKIYRPQFGFFIYRNDRLLVMDTTSAKLGTVVEYCKENDNLSIVINFKMHLLKGTYYIGTHIEDCEHRGFYDYKDHIVTFHVIDSYSTAGVADLVPQCEINKSNCN